MTFAAITRWHESRAAERSGEAESNLEFEIGATIIDRYVTQIRPPTNRDLCGPHVDLSNPRLFTRHILAAVPLLHDLRPRPGMNHVAVYLHSDFFVDETFVNELRRELPHCRFYRHSDHLEFLGWTLTESNEASTQK